VAKFGTSNQAHTISLKAVVRSCINKQIGLYIVRKIQCNYSSRYSMKYIYIYIQGVSRVKITTSGECSLC
jgi:hypothetical protein